MVRELQGVGLKGALDIVEGGVICSGVSKEKAMQISHKYVQKGAPVCVVEDT